MLLAPGQAGLLRTLSPPVVNPEVVGSWRLLLDHLRLPTSAWLGAGEPRADFTMVIAQFGHVWESAVTRYVGDESGRAHELARIAELLERPLRVCDLDDVLDALTWPHADFCPPVGPKPPLTPAIRRLEVGMSATVVAAGHRVRPVAIRELLVCLEPADAELDVAYQEAILAPSYGENSRTSPAQV